MLHIISFPSGRWGFVGKVPVGLAYPGATRGDVENIQQSGPGIARKIAAREGRNLSELTYATQEEARVAFCAFAKVDSLQSLPPADVGGA